jgi:tetratricopeptide (TPR) repeat protein
MPSFRHPLAKLALLLAASLASFLLLEGFLRVAGLFQPPHLLEIRPHEEQKYLTINPAFARLFLQRAGVPSPPHLWVPLEKPQGTRRVILLGESAAAGYPMADLHLGRMVEALWQARYAGQPIQVINLSMVAVSSSALCEFAREAMALEPDMLVVYAGHNEAAGPGGPTVKLGPPATASAGPSLISSIGRTRVALLVGSLFSRLGGSAPLPEWRGLDEYCGVRIAHDDPALDAMRQKTEENFREIMRLGQQYGAKVLFCTPAVNLDDWPPLESDPAEVGGVDAVLAAQDAGKSGGFRSATLVYEAAQKRKADGDLARAWPLYREACDLDERRWRADRGVRALPQKIAAGAGSDVMAVDADRWLHELNPSFTTDREFFLDHVDLAWPGRVAVAELIVDGMAALWGLAPLEQSADAAGAWWSNFPATEKDLGRDLMFTGYDEHDMWSLAAKLLRLDIIAGSPSLATRRTELAEKVKELKRRALLGWDTSDLVVAYERAQLQNPDDALIHFTAGRLLGLRGEGVRAGEAFAKGMTLQPYNPEARLNHAAFHMTRGDADLAHASLAQLKEYDPAATGLTKLEATLALREGDLAAGAGLFKAHLTQSPSDADAWATLAEIQMRVGEYDASEQSRQRAKELSTAR